MVKFRISKCSTGIASKTTCDGSKKYGIVVPW